MKNANLVLLAAVTFAGFQLYGCSQLIYPKDEQAGMSLHEHIEWCDVWVTAADKADLPRVLMIGDSITRGYFKAVEDRLAGKAYCARVTTSKSIGDRYLWPEIENILNQYRFQVIHVNNGLHGRAYTEEQYSDAFGPFMDALIAHSQGARIIWANSTPYKDNPEQTERVKQRNRIACAYAAEHQIPVNDLFGLVFNQSEYYREDGVHFNKTGVDIEAKQVADCILNALEQ